MSDQSNPETPAVSAPGEAAPGPHPHQSEDVKYWRGDNPSVPSTETEAETATTLDTE